MSSIALDSTVASPGVVTIEKSETKGFFTRALEKMSFGYQKFQDMLPEGFKAGIGPLAEFALAIPGGLVAWALASRNENLRPHARTIGATAATVISAIGTLETMDIVAKDPNHFEQEPIGKLINKLPGGNKFISWIKASASPAAADTTLAAVESTEAQTTAAQGQPERSTETLAQVASGHQAGTGIEST